MTDTEKVARVFRRHFRQRVSAYTLLRQVPLAWRTEVSRCRTKLKMRITWEPERVKGKKAKSFYIYRGKAA